MKKNTRILTGGLLILLSATFLGASAGWASPTTVPGPKVTWFPDTQPDVEESDTALPFDEEGGMQAPESEQEGSLNTPFGDITQGSVDQAQDFYSKGSLMNASEFPLETDEILKILRPRNRGFATYDMTAVVGIAANELHQAYPDGERIQIGDVCAAHGGQLAQHISHQNGLDADIVYPRVNHREQDPGISTGFDELFVKDGQISPNFDAERVWFFVKSLVGTGRVVRMFMDPVIKATLCDYAKSVGEYERSTEVLRRIRPLANHQNHVHVRITCPKNSPHCLAQVEPPAGSGCAELDSFL